MITRTPIVLLLVLMGACCSSWAAARPSEDTSKIEALERAWSAAFLRHDTATLAGILADDYVGIDGRGVVTDKPDEIEEAKAPVSDAPPSTYVILGEELSDVRVRLYGNTAILTAINTARIEDQGEVTAVRYRRTTVYVKRGGRWQCVTFHGSRILGAVK